MLEIYLFDTSSTIPDPLANLQVLIHIIDLDDKEDEGNPSATKGGRCKTVEKGPDTMRWHGRHDDDGGDTVENKVVDSHRQLQPSAPLPSGVSENCDGKSFSEHSQHQIVKGHLRQEPLEEGEGDERNCKDERSRKKSAIETRVDAIAIAADASCYSSRAETASTEEGGQHEDGAVLCNHLQLEAKGGISKPIYLPECEEALSASLGDDKEGGGEGSNGHRSFPPLVVKFQVVHWGPDQAKEDDCNLEGRLKVGLPV